MISIVEHRKQEVQSALIEFYSEMKEIHAKRMEISRQEIEAWRRLEQIILADAPQCISKYFKPSTQYEA